MSDRQDLSVLQREYAKEDTVYQQKIKVRRAPAKYRLISVSSLVCCIVSSPFFFFLFLQDLYKKYSYIRKTRPDGNCFYRAFGFAHLESLLDDSKELQK